MEQLLAALFQLFEPTHLAFLFAGTLLGLIVGILPGMGGTSGLALVLPFVFTMEPSHALAMMIGVLAPTTTSDTFPAVLMGVPGTAGSQATVMDGFPLSKKGMAARALSAAFSASLLGGIFGAFILSISIYYAIPIIMAFGFGEQFLLVVLALLMVGALTGDNLFKGIASCFLGLIIGSIGTAPITGDPRYTFNTLYLLEGVPLVVVGLGLFAIPEIVGLLDAKGSIAKSLNTKKGWFTGLKDVVKNWFLVLRCSTLGCLVGALPGLGGTVVDWIAYSHLKQTTKDTSQFGAWHAASWKDKLSLLDKFEDKRLVGFGKKIIFQEAPEVLPPDIFKTIQRGIAKRILSEKREKWWTVSTCFTEIDTLRDKYSDQNDEEKLKFLDELNEYIMLVQKKYENV